jgi:adenylate cyclase
VKAVTDSVRRTVWGHLTRRSAPHTGGLRHSDGHSALHGIVVRRIRLATGLTLFTYISLHLVNHSLGNLSVPAMEAGLVLQKLLWQGVLGTLALYIALTTHLSLGLWAFYERRHFGWTASEVVQVVLGLSIPPLLCNHVYVTRISLAVFGTEKGYAQELYSFWVKSPDLGVQQVIVLIVAWIHGCIGVYFWLRLKPFFARAMPFLLCAAVILPMLALLGFFQGGRTVLALASDPAWQKANLTPGQVGLSAQNAALHQWRTWSNLGGVGLFGCVLLARGARSWRERRGSTIRIAYPDGRSARVPRGFSVLEASRAARVPHASVCGGRARCSTCRVRVVAGGLAVPPASPGEQAVLDRVAADPGVRLACQLRPLGDIAVVPLLPPQRGTALMHRTPGRRTGEERFIVAVMVDMRNSVRLAETRMPFDAVFIIDRFVTAVGDAVTHAGGRVNHFTGDGLIATFGLHCTPEPACRQAIAGLIAIGRNVAALNTVLAGEMDEPILFGVGVHGGTAVVGEIGYAESRVFTTLGDASNVASRLEALCKEFACEAVISEEVCRLSGLGLTALPLHEAAVRGRTAPLALRTVARITDLAQWLPAEAVAGVRPD